MTPEGREFRRKPQIKTAPSSFYHPHARNLPSEEKARKKRESGRTLKELRIGKGGATSYIPHINGRQLAKKGTSQMRGHQGEKKD